MADISTNTRPILDRYSTDTWPTVSRYIGHVSAKCQQILGWYLTDISTNCRPIYWPCIGQVSTDTRPTYWPSVGRYIGRSSANTTYSKQSWSGCYSTMFPSIESLHIINSLIIFQWLSALDSWSNGQDLSPGWGHSVLILGNKVPLSTYMYCREIHGY